eukprot:GILK01012812.1.p1 GENE.GILK01012812.1~~GILK01012812.1.p1  ORF type:complete len:297 (-),score=31.11 GILK01012812.1:71-961(-)
MWKLFILFHLVVPLSFARVFVNLSLDRFQNAILKRPETVSVMLYVKSPWCQTCGDLDIHYSRVEQHFRKHPSIWITSSSDVELLSHLRIQDASAFLWFGSEETRPVSYSGHVHYADVMIKWVTSMHELHEPFDLMFHKVGEDVGGAVRVRHCNRDLPSQRIQVERWQDTVDHQDTIRFMLGSVSLSLSVGLTHSDKVVSYQYCKDIHNNCDPLPQPFFGRILKRLSAEAFVFAIEHEQTGLCLSIIKVPNESFEDPTVIAEPCADVKQQKWVYYPYARDLQNMMNSKCMELSDLQP